MRRAANAWDRWYRTQQAPWRGETLVAELVPLLQGPVLELGCGNGKTLLPLRRAGLDAVGLDISWNVLRRVPGPRVLADARRLPFGSEAFGSVLDLHCTGHLLAEGRRLAAADIARVLRPGGTLVTERLGIDDLRTGTGTWVEGEAWTRRLADGRTTHFSDEADLVGDFVAAGLEVVEVGRIERGITHRGEPVLRSAVRAVLRKPAA
ncbi:MAG TPA: class I SAM-dependent methyltransferase [Candidatus Thermoplasmatota archaeon]|nr:class I SAM-dependent methyltransferase [Candidatus Thermoplasmatota archaeon]